MEAEFFENEFACAVFFQKRDNEQYARNILAHDCCNRNALNVEFCYDDENKVERNIHNTGNRKVYQRTFRIAFCTKYRRTEIVQHVCRRAYEIYEKIIGGFVENFGIGLHPHKKISCAKHADKPHDHAAYEREKHGRMHGFLRALFVFAAYRLTHNHVCAYRQAYHNVDDEIDERNV